MEMHTIAARFDFDYDFGYDIAHLVHLAESWNLQKPFIQPELKIYFAQSSFYTQKDKTLHDKGQRNEQKRRIIVGHSFYCQKNSTSILLHFLTQTDILERKNLYQSTGL